MQDALVALLQALVQQFADNPYKLLAVGAFASAFSWAVKKALVAPKPGDPWWKSALWMAAHVFDKAGLNTEPVAQIRARSNPPPAPPADKGSTLHGVVMLAFLTSLIASTATACAARSPLMREVRAAEVAGPAIRGIHDVILTELKADAEHEVATHPQGGPALADALQNLEDRYQPLRKAYAELDAAYMAYLQAVREANAAGAGSVPMDKLTAAKVAWNALIAEAERMRVDLPDTAEITRLLAGGLKP